MCNKETFSFQYGSNFLSDDLLFAKIPILNNSKCDRVPKFEEEKMICSGIYEVRDVQCPFPNK
jgi:hypothetical protein